MEAGGAEVCISGGISSVCGLKKKEERGEKRKEFNCAKENKAKGSGVQGPAAPVRALLGFKRRVGWRTKLYHPAEGAQGPRFVEQQIGYLYIYLFLGNSQ